MKPFNTHHLRVPGLIIPAVLALSLLVWQLASAQDPVDEPPGTSGPLTREELFAAQEHDFQKNSADLPASSAAVCVGGFAGSYPCHQIDLLAFMPRASLGGGSAANDIWGWTDPLDGTEYALVGMSNGTAFVNLSDPANPVYLGLLPTQTTNSSWRDIKVYANHAFIVSEASGHGLQVFDLTRLRAVASPPVVFSNDGYLSSPGAAHNIAINADSGYAYIVGGSQCSGGLHFIDISSPVSPVHAGCYSADGYSHDVQCVIYAGPDTDYQGREICMAANEDTVSIIDVTQKTSPALLSRNSYSGARYTHQGWLSEDHRLFLLGDELDELNQGHNTRTRIWDVTDLNAPFVIETYTGPNPSIDHNLYIHNGFVYQSNYTSGLQVFWLDSTTATLSQVASFDTYPANNAATFNGSWSNYPFFSSGIVILTGINEGLFVVEPRNLVPPSPTATPTPTASATATATTTPSPTATSTPIATIGPPIVYNEHVYLPLVNQSENQALGWIGDLMQQITAMAVDWVSAP
jgi:choice-of-anchor B domain-containing protein